MKLPAGSTVPRLTGELGEYLKSITANDRVTSDEELTLALAWRDHGCRNSRERLITANLRLVIMVAKRYMNRGLPLDELVAEGNVGLIHAVDNFDPRAGARLSTYAVYWIRHAIANAFSHACRRARMTGAERADLATLEKAVAAFITENGHQASAQELAAELDWHPEKLRSVENIRTARVRPQSLSECSLRGVDVAAAATPIRHADDVGARIARIHTLLSALNADERRIVELRFGLNGENPSPIRQAAETLGEPPRVIRVRLETALRKLSRLAVKTAAVA